MPEEPAFDADMLTTLVVVAETMSFTATAHRMGRSQSTISATVRKLEELAGCRLVDRTTRRVLLTAAGEEMVRHARQIGELTRETKRRLSGAVAPKAVRFGVFTSFSSPMMALALRDFAQLHPGVQVKIETNRSDILLGRFRDDAIDLALVTRQPGHNFGPSIWQDELVWVGNCDVPVGLREPVPLAVRVSPSMLRRLGIEGLNAAGRPHTITFEGNSLPSVAAAVEAGLGFSIFTRTVRPLHLPIVDRPHLLPKLGAIDFVLLKPDHSSRREVRDFHDIVRAIVPELLVACAPSIFGAGPARQNASRPEEFVLVEQLPRQTLPTTPQA